jgi:alpha-D-ribose 1-methylphosphonate 5-phosphate C-P lyase
MAHNIHLESLDHVCGLAKQAAQQMKEDQTVYKTKDKYRYEIFAFTSVNSMAENMGIKPNQVVEGKGYCIRVVRYTRSSLDEVVLQDTGNEQPDVTGKKTGAAKKGTRKAGK